jgi:hypothetical protein
LRSANLKARVAARAEAEAASRKLFVDAYKEDTPARDREWDAYLRTEENHLRQAIRENPALQQQYLSDIHRDYPDSHHMLFSNSPHYVEIGAAVSEAGLKRKQVLFSFYAEHPHSDYRAIEDKLRKIVALKPDYYSLEKNLETMRTILHTKPCEAFIRRYYQAMPLEIRSLPDEAQVKKILLEAYDQKRSAFIANPLPSLEDAYLKSKSPRYNPHLKPYVLEQWANKAYEAHRVSQGITSPTEAEDLSETDQPDDSGFPSNTASPLVPETPSDAPFVAANRASAAVGLGPNLMAYGMMGSVIGGLGSGFRSLNPLRGLVRGAVVGVVAGGVNHLLHQSHAQGSGLHTATDRAAAIPSPIPSPLAPRTITPSIHPQASKESSPAPGLPAASPPIEQVVPEKTPPLQAMAKETEAFDTEALVRPDPNAASTALARPHPVDDSYTYDIVDASEKRGLFAQRLEEPEPLHRDHSETYDLQLDKAMNAHPTEKMRLWQLSGLDASAKPVAEGGTAKRLAEWLQNFAIGTGEGWIAMETVSVMAKHAKFLPWLKGFGWLGVASMVSEGMQMTSALDTGYSACPEDFQDIMQMAMIPEAKKQAILSHQRETLARLQGHRARSLLQIIEENPKSIGLLFIGGLSLAKATLPKAKVVEPFSELALVDAAEVATQRHQAFTPAYRAHRARHTVPAPGVNASSLSNTSPSSASFPATTARHGRLSVMFGESMEMDFYSKSELIGVFNYEHRGVLPNRVASTFIGDRYSTYHLKADHVFYRSGTETGELGQFFSFERPKSVIQTRIDHAIPPIWPDGKSAVIDTGFSIKAPKGTTVHVGESTQQGGVFLGGTSQIVIENPRFIDGLAIIEKFSLHGAKKHGKN